MERPGLKKLLDDIAAGKIDKRSNFARDEGIQRRVQAGDSRV
jgi:hypothetical protein